MRTLNTSVLLLIVLFFLGATISTNTFAQEKKSVTVTGKEVDKSRGENPNIKSKAPDTDENPAPKPKGSLCSIDFENWTGYYVDIYVNSYFKGTVGPWGVYPVDVYAGYTSIYCITAGGTLEWLNDGSCDYYFVYELHAP
jgi:hypothetical protein